MSDDAGLVTIDVVRAAASLLDGVAVRTPLVAFGSPGDRRYLKAESLQPIGAFKIRGAYVAIASLSSEARAQGVITYSSGNHAQGVARAARATPWAWLPDEYVITPRARSSGISDATAT